MKFTVYPHYTPIKSHSIPILPSIFHGFPWLPSLPSLGPRDASGTRPGACWRAAGGSAAAADAALRRRAQEPGLVGPLGEAAELLGIWGDKKGGMNGKGISWGLLGI